ncbi:MAG TPA: sulfite exporter TauE/SafE family protein [Vicinamibacterales bacterium]|nr:sulfite exporter TauE/SafE family protein [Vicinamibacterales bacterium]
MNFASLVGLASVVAGGIAAVSGFGIGSVLTPLFESQYDIKLAVAAVSVPHVIATAVRLWRLRRDVDPTVLKSFGLMSAAGGLTGAVLQRYAAAPGLTLVFAALLIFVGVLQLTGLSERMRFGTRTGWVAGVLSGALGGLVGNQGGIRSAALLGYDLSPARFVATATAAGLIVDAARMPVYVITEHARLIALAPLLAIASVGAVIGTFAGARLLKKIPPHLFRTIVGGLVLALGVYMFFRR